MCSPPGVVCSVRRSTVTGSRGLAFLVLASANLTLATRHLPALYDAAVRNQAVHVLEHVLFVVTATLFWWMVLGAGRRERRGLGVLGVFVATLPATACGVPMTLAATLVVRAVRE